MVTKNEMVAILAALTTDFDSAAQEHGEANQEMDLEFGQAQLESERNRLEEQRKAG